MLINMMFIINFNNMTYLSDLIEKLQELEEKHGDVEINIYKSFDKKTARINVDDIYYDEKLKYAYIGIYN